MIGFTEIPGGGALRTPFFFAELDPSQANQGQRLPKALIIGQQLPGGTLTPGVPVLAESVTWVKQKAGQGSMLALMVEAYRRRDDFGPVYVLPLSDDAAGVAAVKTISFTGAPSAAGTLVIALAGQRVAVALSSTMTAAQVATAYGAAVNAQPDLPVAASVAAGVVTLTAKNKGVGGNETQIDVNALPPGLAVGTAHPTVGSGNPVAGLTSGLASLGDTEFDFIAMPFADTECLDLLKTHLASRWSYARMLYGGAFACLRATLSQATTVGSGRNDAHVSIMPAAGMPEPNYVWAAAITAAAAESLRADPGLPMQTVPLSVQPPHRPFRWEKPDRNGLLFAGMSTFTVADDGQVAIERLITTYQKNAFGQPDDSQLDVERLYTLAAIIRRLRTSTTTKFARFKLADDGKAFRPGSRIVTPSIIRDHILGDYRAMEAEGLVQGYEAFRKNLVVERNSANRCRVDILLPAIPIDQLRQLALLVQFRNAGEA